MTTKAMIVRGGALLAVAGIGVLAGCNTVSGAREDIRVGGEKINRQIHPDRYPPPPPRAYPDRTYEAYPDGN